MALKLGFMEPNGILHECAWMEHIYKAEELCDTFGYREDCYRLIGVNYSDCEDYLLMKGWMEIGGRNIKHGVYGVKLRDGSEVFVHLSEAQKKFLEDNLANAANDDQYLGMKWALDMDECLNKKENN